MIEKGQEIDEKTELNSYLEYICIMEARNVKIKSKVQGSFRSDLGSDIYCRVRGYIVRMKKNEHNQYEALKKYI